MHETALARRILAAVLLQTAREGRVRIRTVRGWVAETEALSLESLQLNFVAAARGTVAEGSSLELRLIHVAARCCACSRDYSPEHHLLLCPACGSNEAELLGPVGLGIEAVEVDLP